jgi:hypothetical protein
MKILAYEQRMASFLTRSAGDSIDTMEGFRTLRASKDVWDSFKAESTTVEVAMLEVLWEVYQCHLEVIESNPDRLGLVTNILSTRKSIGSDQDDMTWRTLHDLLLNIRVIHLSSYLLVDMSVSSEFCIDLRS